MIIPKPKKLAVSNQAVLDSVAKLPRNHLGDVPYEIKLKPARLQDPRTGRPPRYGFQSTPVPLPWNLIKDHVNCTLTVKVGKQHLVPAAREEITSRRAVWGTDIYTDDSDVVAACIHAGWIRGEWPEEVDVDLLDLYTTDEKDKKGKSRATKLATQANNLVVLDAPPKGGPQNVPENRDLHVTVLILPALEKYASSCRFGIRSREFGGEIGDIQGLQHRAKHDGLSFMITGLRWVNNGAGTQNRLRGKARRERIRRALREVELGPVWAAKSLNVDSGKAAEVVKLAAAPIDGDVEMTGNWWKHRGTPPSEGDKENVPATVGVADKEVPVPATQEAVSEPAQEPADKPGKETTQAEPEAGQDAASDEVPTAKEVDADETMGEDTIVEEDKNEDDKQDDQEADKKAEEAPNAEEPSKAEVVDSEKAAETTSEVGVEQAGQDAQETGGEASPKDDSPKVSAGEATEPSVEAAKEPIKEPVKDTATEQVEEVAKETTKEPDTEPAKEPAEESVKEPATEDESTTLST
jgi:hypothetical protein